jgi:thermitase
LFHVKHRGWRLLLAVCLSVGVVLAGWQLPVAATGMPTLFATRTGPDFAAGIVLAKPRAGIAPARIASLAGAQSISTLARLGIVKMHVTPGQERAMTSRLRQSGLVDFASPDYFRHVALTPNDPDYQYQWALPKVDAPTAWQTSLGSSHVVVALIDTGYDFTHPDRPAHLIAGPTYTSYATLDGCAPETTSVPQDDNGHGTHVGGIIAAAFDNGIGVAGLAPNTSLLIIKAADCSGSLADSDVAQALVYAADAGARVINMSFGGSDASDVLNQAVQYAAAKGAVLVAAAGNQSSNAPFYPAWLPNVVAVSATDSNDTVASFSNYGPDIAVAAPGVSILSTVPTFDNPSGYAEDTGTSMAAPHVSAIAGLVLSVAPVLTNTQVVQAIERGATAIGEVCPSIFYGYGRVDAAGALTAAETIASAGLRTTQDLPYHSFLPLVASQHCGLN